MKHQPNEERRERSRRAIAGLALPAVALALLGGVALGIDGPDPMATHWGFGGEPDDSMGRTAFLIMVFLISGLAGIATFLATRRRDVVRGELMAPVAITTFLQWVFAGVGLSALLANAGRDAWTDARSLSVPVALLVPLGAAIVAVVAGRMVSPVGEQPERDDAERPTVARRAGERLSWRVHVRSTWPIALGGVVATVGCIFLFNVGVVAGTAVLLAGAAVAMFATIQVTADRRGLIVTYGPGRWPRTTIGLDRITHAEVIDVRPMHHGGWGYRGSVRVFGRAAVVVRAGEGIQLDLVDGKRFVVTVDDAETGAGTINDLLRPEPAQAEAGTG